MAVSPAPAAIEAGNWAPTFFDDFTDRPRFERQWQKITNAGEMTKTLRRPENAVLVGDGLALELGNNTNDATGKLPFTGGYVQSSDFGQRYGYFECEMRIAAEAGVNNAFWLVSDAADGSRGTFELDVAEVKYPGSIQATARQWKPTRRVLSRAFRSRLDLSAGFHRYGLMWQPRAFAYYFDDHRYFEATNDFAQSRGVLRLSNAVAAFAGVDDGSVAGAATVIRQVRVYQNTDWLSASEGVPL